MIAFALRRPFAGALALYAIAPIVVVAALFGAGVLIGVAATIIGLRSAFEAALDPVAAWIGHAAVAWGLKAPLPLAAAALVRRAWMYETDRQHRTATD